MDKKKRGLRRQQVRMLIQIIFAAVSNGYLVGFAKGKIYTGNLKYLCAPGMNCYSCPGALASCPIGSLQAVLTDRQFRFSLYVLGMLFVMGSVFGRAICGFLCPFGWIQDLLYRIPFFVKCKKLPMERVLRMIKYVMLVVFVIVLPLVVVDVTGLGKPWFCKYICPVGTLEGGVTLVLLQKGLRSAVGWLFGWKMFLLIGVLVLAMIVYRPFCRYLCPLGAFYGLFNRFAIYRTQVESEHCVGCGACQKACHFDIPVWKNPNSVDCIRCGACIDACPKGCVHTTVLGYVKKSS